MTIVYARSGFSEPALTLFTLLAVIFIYKYEATKQTKYIFLSGFLVGFSLLIKDVALIYIPLLLLYIIWKSLTLRLSIYSLIKLWLLSITPVLIFLILYHFNHTFMTPSEAHLSKGVAIKLLTSTKMLKGIYYYLFSAGKGYFFYNAPLLLGLFAIKNSIMRRKNIAIFCIIFIITNLFFYSCIFKRGSLFSWGPRYLYPTIPFMCVFLAQFIESAASKFKKILIALFCFIGFIIQIPCLFINFSKYLFFVKEQLNLPEYFINFIPELSPIGGSWMLFLSAVNKTFTNISLNFRYNPDYLFSSGVIKGLQGYDVWDIWWVNVVKVAPQLLSTAIIIVSFMIIILVASFIGIRLFISKEIPKTK